MGEAREDGREEIGAGRRGWPARRAAAAQLGSARASSSKGMKGGEKDRVARTDKNGAAQRTRFAGILDVWSRRRCRAGRGMGGVRRTGEHSHKV